MRTVPKNTVSMGRRLSLALISTMTLIAVLVATVFYHYNAAELERNFSLKVEETLSFLDGSLGPILWHFDHNTVVWVAKTALQDDQVVGVIIRDEQKQLIYAIDEEYSDDVLVRNRLISFEGEPVGELELVFSRALLKDTLTNILINSLLVWLLTAVSIGVLTKLFIAKFFRGPLEAFIDLAESYRHYPESRSLNTTPFLEFQPIEDVVKKLADEVLLKIDELDEHRKNLEKEVAKRTEEFETANSALRISEKRLKEAQHTAKLGRWKLDIQTNKLDWSDEVFNIFEIDQNKFDASYDAFLATIHPDDREKVAAAYQQSLENKQPYEINHRLLMKDGRIKYLRELCRTEYSDDGTPLQSIGAVQDITALMEVENQLKEAKEVAEAANKAKSTFLANMSHELRTPLNGILGFTDMLRRAPDTSASQQEKLDIINRSGEHLLSMINDVLDLSKIEAGKIVLEPEVFDLVQMLRDVGEMFEQRAETEGLKFNLELDAGLTKTIEADAGKLRQILINLLGNAVKFTTEGGVSLRARTVAIEDEPSMVSLQLEIEDSGQGITPKQQEKIFEPFIQDKQFSSDAKGTGLGLSITKSFVELMAGKISVESKLAVGSLFRVDLPVVVAESTEIVRTQAAKPDVLGLKENQTNWRILIVEDNEDNRLLLNSLLSQVGFEVKEASNGQEGVELFKTWQPHFIWMDMRMPVMDGYEATATIRGLPGGDAVKIVALTASAFKEQRSKIIDAGCDEVLHKPYRDYEIFTTLEQYLGVDYLYADDKEENLAEQVITLTAEMMKKLPAELTEQLRLSAFNLDMTATKAVIEVISRAHPELADGLKPLVEHFQFSKILELIDGEGD